MKLNHEYKDLRRAAVLVQEREQRIAEQKTLVAKLRDSGKSTLRAEATLKSFERSLLEMQNHGIVLSDLLQSGPSTVA
jgi:hypothetical protein